MDLFRNIKYKRILLYIQIIELIKKNLNSSKNFTFRKTHIHTLLFRRYCLQNLLFYIARLHRAE